VEDQQHNGLVRLFSASRDYSTHWTEKKWTSVTGPHGLSVIINGKVAP